MHYRLESFPYHTQAFNGWDEGHPEYDHKTSWSFYAQMTPPVIARAGLTYLALKRVPNIILIANRDMYEKNPHHLIFPTSQLLPMAVEFKYRAQVCTFMPARNCVTWSIVSKYGSGSRYQYGYKPKPLVIPSRPHTSLRRSWT